MPNNSLTACNEMSDAKAMNMEILNNNMTVEINVMCEVNGNK